jgi:hypothetical protein
MLEKTATFAQHISPSGVFGYPKALSCPASLDSNPLPLVPIF